MLLPKLGRLHGLFGTGVSIGTTDLCVDIVYYDVFKEFRYISRAQGLGFGLLAEDFWF